MCQLFRKNWRKKGSSWSEKFSGKKTNRKENWWKCSAALKSESNKLLNAILSIAERKPTTTLSFTRFFKKVIFSGLVSVELLLVGSLGGAKNCPTLTENFFLQITDITLKGIFFYRISLDLLSLLKSNLGASKGYHIWLL